MRCKKLEANWLESRWGEIGWKITSGSPDFLCFSKKKRISSKPCRVDFFSGWWYKVIDKYHTQCIVPNHIKTQPYKYISNLFYKYIKCTADLHNMKKRGNVLTAQPKKVNFCANLIFLGDRITHWKIIWPVWTYIPLVWTYIPSLGWICRCCIWKYIWQFF